MLALRSFRISFGLATALLAACSGGGGSPAPSASASPSPQRSSTPSATPSPSGSASAELSVDCSIEANLCPSLTIPADPPGNAGFHGYADPAIRKDPASATLFLGYSWLRVLSDGTHVVDLHLAHSLDNGASWNYDGALYTSQTFANPGNGAYAATNDTSTETVDLYPIAEGGSTLWLQAHIAYLVPPQGGLYSQINTTEYISLTASSVPAGSAPAALLGLSTASEARLGNAGTDPTLAPTTNLSTLNAAMTHCTQFQQPALVVQGSTLYLGVQCFEGTPSGDASNTAYFLISTQLTGTDARSWTWTYDGEFATPAQAVKLGTAEGTPYQFFTELTFAENKNGTGLLAILSPSIASMGQQPAQQYGCRAIPMSSLSPPVLQTNASGAPVVVAKVTENDLYTAPNEGPGACAYEPQASNGILIVRKLEDDPSLGFYLTFQSSDLRP
jgi:hypothetical protein